MRDTSKQVAKNRLIIARVCYLVSRLLNLSPLFASRYPHLFHMHITYFNLNTLFVSRLLESKGSFRISYLVTRIFFIAR